MRRWIRLSLFVLAALATMVVLAAAGVMLRAEYRLSQRLAVPERGVAVRTDAAARERGRYLFASLGCGGCHGADGGGHVMWESGANRLVAPHIAPGAGSVTAAYRPQDWDRAVRHGLRPDGRGLVAMPSIDYSRLADDDLGALVGHIVHLPAVDHDPGRHRLGTLLKAAIGLGRMPLAPDAIDHGLPPSPPVAATVSLERGRYVAQACVGCHGPQLRGGPIPGMPPGTPAAADLLPGAGQVLQRYPDAAALRTMFRSGRRPDGSPIAVMPFASLSQLDDTDGAALHLYLTSLPAVR